MKKIQLLLLLGVDPMINWDLAKKSTLWDYEEFIKKICETFSYTFIQEHYNHRISEAACYFVEILGHDSKREKTASKIANVFIVLESYEVKDYLDLINQVNNKKKCKEYLKKTKLNFEDLLLFLNYIYRWVLPHRIYLRELIDVESNNNRNYIEKLRDHGIRFNLDILEYCRTRLGRKKLSNDADIPESIIIKFMNLADMSRLPFSNRKTVKHLQAGGYSSLIKLAKTDTETIVKDMKRYFNSIGVKPYGFIDLDGIAQWAKNLPIIVEE
jgi:hypothetical protein